MFRIKHNPISGRLAKITLIKAKVKGSYEYVAILILKKEDPQITANNVNRKRSEVLASFISSLNCICVKNA